MKKTIVIGFDGATPQLIKKWSQQGKLPNFSKILSDGVYGDLETTIPPLTPCAWSSFMTGKNPGKHGIYDFFYLDKQHEIKINTSNSRSAKDIWEILSENDFKCFVFNVPFTYPPKKIKGLMVTDFTTPSTDSEFTYPVSLRETILKKYTGFAFSEKSKYAENYKARRDFRNDVFNLADLRFKIANDLIKENECDFYMVTFMIADHIQHWYWKFMDREHPDYIKDDNFEKTIENAYIKLDSFLGELMKTFSGHNIFIMSDHGSGPYYQDVTLNNWLMDQGYLCMKKNQSAFKNVLGRIGVNKLITFGLNIGLWKMVSKSSKLKSFIQKKMMRTYQDIDWEKTKAFSFGYYGPIFLNKEAVPSREKQSALKNELKEKLFEIREPRTQKQLINKVWFKEQLYEGQKTDILPDIVTDIGDFKYASSSSFPFSSPQLFSNPKTFKTGDHSMHGIFMAYGPDIKKGREIKNARIYDVAPTILRMFDIKAPEDMDGKILKDIFNENANFSNTKKKPAGNYTSQEERKDLTDRDEEKVKDRLKDLGYF